MESEPEKKRFLTGWHEHHAHLFLGGARRRMEELFETEFPDFRYWKIPLVKPASEEAIGRVNAWIRECFLPAVKSHDWRKLSVQAALEQANADGVSRLEASLNVDFSRFGTERLLREIAEVHAQTAPDLELKLDLGFVRSQSVEFQAECFQTFLKTAERFPELGELLGGVDLYDVEDAALPENFREIFQIARAAGLKLKAHVGETGSPEVIRHTAEILNLDEIQHGIRAGESKETLAFLADRKTVLNLAPASNRILCLFREEEIQERVRAIFDSKVPFTLSSDDYLLFETSIVEQFQEIASIFSEDEQTQIRKNCQNL